MADGGGSKKLYTGKGMKKGNALHKSCGVVMVEEMVEG